MDFSFRFKIQQKILNWKVVYGYGQNHIGGGSRGIGPFFFQVHFFHVFFPVFFFPVLFPPYFLFPYFLHLLFSVLFCSIFFPVFLFSCTFFPYFLLPYFFSPYYFFHVLFTRNFSKVATFEIQRFKISVSCFSSTYRYITVHVPCGIAIKTSWSPVGLPLDGWGARIWRDQKWTYLT